LCVEKNNNNIKEMKMVYKNICFHNVAEIIETEDGMLMTRIPDGLRVILNEGVQTRALMPAGCEMRFNLRDGEARIILKLTEGEGVAEVFQGNFQVGQYFIDEKPAEMVVGKPANLSELRMLSAKNNLPFCPELTRIIMPYRYPVKIAGINGGEFGLPEKRQLPEKRYLAYGSSITHGQNGVLPTGTYAMRTAQMLGADLLNMGFGSGAHCERQMADYIASRKDWDFASLEMGINMVTGFDADEFKNRVEYFVAKIAESHPGKYIFCIDMFPFYMDFTEGETKNEIFREIVKKAVFAVNSRRVIHIDGRDILKDASGLMTDLVHPSPSGMQEMATNLSNIIRNCV